MNLAYNVTVFADFSFKKVKYNFVISTVSVYWTFALYCSFEEYNQTVCWYTRMSRCDAESRVLYVFFCLGLLVLLELCWVWGPPNVTISSSVGFVIKMLEYHWTEITESIFEHQRTASIILDSTASKKHIASGITIFTEYP